MYKCFHCEEVFDEPETSRYELCRIDGVPYYGNDHVCPCCGSTDIDEVHQCDVCGGYFPEHEIDTDDEGHDVCPDCFDIAENPYHGCTINDIAFRMLEVV